VNRDDVEAAMREFVSDVLRWCSSSEDDRGLQLKEDWEAVASASADERLFCESAGRMGLDPYAISEWPEGLAEFIDSEIGDRLREPLVRDLFEATEPESAQAVWTWIGEAQAHWKLSAHDALWKASSRFQWASDYGYALATRVRNAANFTEAQPISEIEDVAASLDGFRLTFEDQNDVPSRAVKAVVGWADSATAKIVGPLPQRPDNARFLKARGLYHALNSCPEGARLLTTANTWDQQASRAFAAELLVPREALAAKASTIMDSEDREKFSDEMAREYNVSSKLIEHQMQNQGIWQQVVPGP
jgi:hypothetical protein